MPTDTFASFGHRVNGFMNDISGPRLAALMTKAGMDAKRAAREAASADLGGDPKFSGWAPTLDVRFTPVGIGKLLITPTRRSAGPWTVAEYGRHSAAGPPGGKRRRQWNGRTQGKQTASEAVQRIQSETPQLFEAEVKRSIQRNFG